MIVVGAIIVAFESRNLNTAQQNYCAFEHELFAIIHALKKWCHYLYGATFKVVFDHENIKQINNT